MYIHRSSIKNFVMPKVKSVIVIDYYEGIQGMLASRGDFPYDDFLANPRYLGNRRFLQPPIIIMRHQRRYQGQVFLCPYGTNKCN